MKVTGGQGKAKMPDVLKGQETVLSREDEPKYRVSRVTCPAMCNLNGADVDNTVAIVPITAATISIDGKSVTKNPYEAIVVNRKTPVSVTGAATLIVVRVP